MKRSYLKRNKGFRTDRPRKPLKRGKLAPRRKNRSQREILRDKAWQTFSRWIRARDKKCVTCGSVADGQAGHFYHGVLDFDEININRQCARCNKWLHGNLAVYSNYLLEKYGEQAFKDLTKRHYTAMKGELRSEQDYIKIVEKYGTP